MSRSRKASGSRKAVTFVTLEKGDYLDLVLARQAIERALRDGQARIDAVTQEAEQAMKSAQAAFAETMKTLRRRYSLVDGASYDFDDANHRLVPVRPQSTEGVVPT